MSLHSPSRSSWWWRRPKNSDTMANGIRTANLVVLLSASLCATAAGAAQPGPAEAHRTRIEDPLAGGWYGGHHDHLKLLELANHGDRSAKYELGMEYKAGTWEVRPDQERALQWFEEAALAGVPDAMTQVGTFYALGIGGSLNPAEALFWYRRARMAKSAGGTLALAEMHCRGAGTPRDIPRCAAFLNNAVNDLQPSDSQFNLGQKLAVQLVAMGRHFETGDGVKRDVVQADAWYARGAAMGDADGMLAEARLAMAPGNPRANLERALAVLQDLAAKRRAFGPDQQPLTYEQETELAREVRKVAATYERQGGEVSARAIPVQILLTTLGETDGALRLARRYAAGSGVPRSTANAERLLKAVANPDNPGEYDHEQYWRVEGLIAEDYFQGQGVPKDVPKAIELYQSAADEGDVSSSVMIGLLYAAGNVVAFDPDKASAYLRFPGDSISVRPPFDRQPVPVSVAFAGPTKQAIAGLAPMDKRRFGKAARLLGEHYESGNGVEKSLLLARIWYRDGAAAGDAIAKTRLAHLPAPPPAKLEVPKIVAMVGSAGLGSGVVAMAREAEEVKTASPPAPPQPAVEERYPNIETPDTVHPSQEFAVLVSLTGEQIAPETRIMSGNQREGRLLIPMPAGMASIDLEVDLSASGMEFVGGSNIAQIELSKDQDSTVAQFHLRARPNVDTGKPARLIATFWYSHAFLARVERDIQVVPDASEAAAIAAPAATAGVAKSAQPAVVPVSGEKQSGAGFVFDPEMTAPDLTIYESRIDDVLHLTFVTRYASTVEAQLPRAAEMRSYIRMKLEELARQGRGLTTTSSPVDVQRNDDVARGFGDELYERFAPPEFKQLYWQLHDAGVLLRTVQVLSDDPMLPWELMRPARTGGKDRQDFLGLSARVARWQMGATGLPRPPQALKVEKMIVIAPHYTGSMTLDAAQQEADSLRGDAGFESVKGDYSDVRTLASDLPEGIVHFAGHGVVRDDNGGPQFAILLEDGELEPATWKTLVSASHAHPFYFFNACEVGQARQAVGALDGWAPALLDTGASGYLGALWPVSDRAAGSFAANFYRILLKNDSMPVAEVVRQARQRTFDETHDPTALSYVLYADPFLEVRR
jgi:TPR repeat protein